MDIGHPRLTAAIRSLSEEERTFLVAARNVLIDPERYIDTVN